MIKQEEFDFQGAIESIREQHKFDFVGIAMTQSREHHELRWTFVTGNQSERYRRIVLHSGRGIAGIVFKTGKPMLVENVEHTIPKEELFGYPIIVTEELKSFGAVPLLLDGRVKGVLLVGFRATNRLNSEKFSMFKQHVEMNLSPFHIREVVEY